MYWHSPFIALALASAAPSVVAECNPRENRYCTEIRRLAQDSRVRRALMSIERNNARARRDLIELTQIPAPPFKEEVRARRFLQMLRESGADSVWIDSVGNAIGLRRGTGGGRTVVLEGHLDTVFPEGTDVTVKVRGDTLAAPGIGDDTRGLVVVLETLRALNEAQIRTQADVLFIGTVGEEGLGDLRGVKHLFREGAPKIDSYIAVDGGDLARVAVEGIGSHRYKVTYKGPGGHSWGAFGTANPVHALGRAIRLFDERADRHTKTGPRTTYNVGRIGGGTSVNSVAFEAWMEVDMRSESDASLQAIDKILQESVQQALREQNSLLRRDDPLTVTVEMVGNRPSGKADPQAPLVQRTRAAIAHLGGKPELGSGSTNSNLPFSLGVPAVTIGRGGKGGDAHALTEWWIDDQGHLAIQNALLLVLADAGMSR
ncbi:MAG: M20/M25/M40 family metallo-hydrolase [Gemmatimonadetes bacterium]|jgi:acetylornithine deacetylase/succinyl-diaminopimelate desuccinylase-like protein|nr:M20/M25/M40 family metallo-hydrolase [Gemmatimonadota bacterium]